MTSTRNNEYTIRDEVLPNTRIHEYTNTRNNEYTIRDEVSPNTRIHERTNSRIIV